MAFDSGEIITTVVVTLFCCFVIGMAFFEPKRRQKKALQKVKELKARGYSTDEIVAASKIDNFGTSKEL